jgi:hypothetical protein
VANEEGVGRCADRTQAKDLVFGTHDCLFSTVSTVLARLSETLLLLGRPAQAPRVLLNTRGTRESNTVLLYCKLQD